MTIYEQGSTIGRKYLVAGKGGFNLSHDLPIEQLVSNYFPNGFLDQALSEFSVDDLREWYHSLGIETFVGSSGRIFPKEGISPGDVVRA